MAAEALEVVASVAAASVVAVDLAAAGRTAHGKS